MARININDRASLEQIYPADAFAADALQNEKVPSETVRSVRVDTAPDRNGWFELVRAIRHVGEPETPNFLAPARHTAPPVEHVAPQQGQEARPPDGYEQFIDNVLAAARRYGYRVEESPGQGDPRIRGLRQ